MRPKGLGSGSAARREVDSPGTLLGPRGQGAIPGKGCPAPARATSASHEKPAPQSPSEDAHVPLGASETGVPSWHPRGSGDGCWSHVVRERLMAAGGAGGARRSVLAAAPLLASRAFRVIAHRDGHHPDHLGPHVAPPALGQPAHSLHRPRRRRQGALHHAQ